MKKFKVFRKDGTIESLEKTFDDELSAVMYAISLGMSYYGNDCKLENYVSKELSQNWFLDLQFEASINIVEVCDSYESV